jgi:DNA-binding NarL/FixJ family response regulator
LREDASFEVILCDVQLPDGTAATIFAAYCAQWPERAHRFVFLSGGTDDPLVRSLVASGKHPVLRKPFDLDALPALIEQQASVVRIG